MSLVDPTPVCWHSATEHTGEGFRSVVAYAETLAVLCDPVVWSYGPPGRFGAARAVRPVEWTRYISHLVAEPGL